MIVYHYTSEEAYNEIVRTNEFRPSSFSTALDAAYGEGWYFTDLDPNTTDRDLFSHLWRQPVSERAKYYLEFDIDADLLQNTRLHVYRLPLDRIRGGIIELGDGYMIGNEEAIEFVGGEAS